MVLRHTNSFEQMLQVTLLYATAYYVLSALEIPVANSILFTLYQYKANKKNLQLTILLRFN